MYSASWSPSISTMRKWAFAAASLAPDVKPPQVMKTPLLALCSPREPTNSRDRAGADVGLVPLGLHVDHVEAQPIFFDNPVDAAVAAFADDLGRVELRAAVPHRDEDIDNELLEHLRFHGADAF